MIESALNCKKFIFEKCGESLLIKHFQKNYQSVKYSKLEN